MATQKINMPKMQVISQEKVAERAASEKMEKAMREKYSKTEFPKEYERFSGFLKTLDAEKIRLSVTGKDGKVEEHSFTPSEAENQAWRLLAAREAGSMVKIEPESREHNYIVVSGLTESSLKQMKEDGYGAALTTETDAGRFQSVFKVRAGAEGERKEIAETLATRYGNGQQEKIVVPGFYSDSLSRIPRVVSCNEAASVLGPGRLMEKIKEQAPVYAEHEQQMKAFAAEQPQVEPQQSHPPHGQEGNGQQKKEEAQQQQGQAQGNSLFNMLLAALRAIALILRDIFANALGRVRVPGLTVQEHKAEPPFWRDKSQWKTEELLQNPAFSKEQKLAVEAPAQAQEKLPEIKVQAKEQTQNQEQTKSRKKGRSR